MLKYEIHEEVVQIEEKPNGNDTEFHIHILEPELCLPKIREIQTHFDENRVHTDVLFYALGDRHYQVIVRADYYEEFVLQLMRHRLLRSVKWE
ncbi:hypothetical protein ACFFK0_23690 [Paenibacillus chartarius]|uniref:Uncharacterized protein n=1 Tax=Paenibacillus chartarius TaxID=747481 RepID=A0ABV6DRX0_9BACL